MKSTEERIHMLAEEATQELDCSILPCRHDLNIMRSELKRVLTIAVRETLEKAAQIIENRKGHASTMADEIRSLKP